MNTVIQEIKNRLFIAEIAAVRRGQRLMAPAPSPPDNPLSAQGRRTLAMARKKLRDDHRPVTHRKTWPERRRQEIASRPHLVMVRG